MLLQINDRVKAMGDQAQGQLAEEFARIDAATTIWAGTSWTKFMLTSLVRRLLWCASSSSTAPMPLPALCLEP